MRPKIAMEILPEVYDELTELAQLLGVPQEAAMSYAVRLVAACIRDGLLTDEPSAAWPEEAREMKESCTGTLGKVIAFPGGAKKD